MRLIELIEQLELILALQGDRDVGIFKDGEFCPIEIFRNNVPNGPFRVQLIAGPNTLDEYREANGF